MLTPEGIIRINKKNKKHTNDNNNMNVLKRG